MIKLSNRLKEIANMIDKHDTTIDIGCDHALLDIYLVDKYNNICYASDLRKQALDKGLENIKKYKLEDKIVLRCEDGLNSIYDNDNIDTVIISGMGYNTIINILKNKDKLKNIKKIIIESNNKPEIVRKYMIDNGYYIDKERLAFDNNFYYFVTCYKKGNKKYTKNSIRIGLIKDDPLKKEYINNLIKKNNVLLSLLPKNKLIKRFKIKKFNKLLKNY